jgi:CheY-like chemotaxis protein
MTGQYIDRDACAQTVLIVEDDADISALLVAILEEEAHYQTLHAYNGYQALEIVKRYHPDLLLLDYHLPDINGLDLYDYLSQIEGLQDLPMLLVSANPPVYELRKRRLSYLKKPFELDDLLAKVDTLINQHTPVTLYQYI